MPTVLTQRLHCSCNWWLNNELCSVRCLNSVYFWCLHSSYSTKNTSQSMFNYHAKAVICLSHKVIFFYLVVHNCLWNLFLHLFNMPKESELLHMKTQLASLIKLVVAWLSPKCSTSLRPNTKKNAKTTQSKGRVYTTSDMSSHRYSQHAPLHKRKLGKESQFLFLEHHWALGTKQVHQ